MDTLTSFENYLLSRGLSPATAKIYLGHLHRPAVWTCLSADTHRQTGGTYGEFDPAAVTSLDVADYRVPRWGASSDKTVVHLYRRNITGCILKRGKRLSAQDMPLARGVTHKDEQPIGRSRPRTGA